MHHFSVMSFKQTQGSSHFISIPLSPVLGVTGAKYVRNLPAMAPEKFWRESIHLLALWRV